MLASALHDTCATERNLAISTVLLPKEVSAAIARRLQS